MRSAIIGAALAALMLVMGSGSPLPAQSRPAGTTRTDLQRHDLSIAGHEVFQARVDFAPGASFPRHTHPGEEIIYVLDGGKPATELATYALEKEKPLTVFVK